MSVGVTVRFSVAQMGAEDIADLVAIGAIWIAQWFLLREVVTRAGWWIVASVIGGTLGFLVGAIEGNNIQDFIDGVAASPMGVDYGPDRSAFGIYSATATIGSAWGAILGYAQWIVLRFHFRKAGWWVLASTLGFALGTVFNFLYLIPTLVTGISLKWLPFRGEFQETRAHVPLFRGVIQAAGFDRTLPASLRNTDHITTDFAIITVILPTVLGDIVHHAFGQTDVALQRDILAGITGTLQFFFAKVLVVYVIGRYEMNAEIHFGAIVRILGFCSSPYFLAIGGVILGIFGGVLAILTFPLLVGIQIWVVAASVIGLQNLLNIDLKKAVSLGITGEVAYILAREYLSVPF